MGSEAVRVIVRCRPMNEREDKLNCEVVLTMDTSIAQVQLRKPKVREAPPKLFTFDGVYYMLDTTEQIYDDICFPLVAGVLEGYNGTVFAYGQTGCGKSYTMMGVEDPVENRGIIPRAFDHIFDHVASSDSVKYLLTASYLEIYNEEVRDLLGRDVKKRLELHEHPERGVYVQGLSHHKVHNVHSLSHIMELGSKSRSVGATLMNVDSSRSHSIFTIDLEMVSEGGEGGIRAGRLNLVDLAGSERQSKTGSTGDRLKEATKINLSLSALGNVISALVDGRSTHIPYRDSKLTRLLQSSLGGNTKTLMVACISPADNNYDETLSTLRYANRAKNIKNKPRINEDPKDALLRQYKEEIERLKAQLLGGEGPSGGDTALRQALAERQKRAEDKRALLLRANQSLVDDDGIIERIFNSLTDEVRAKTSALERSQVRLRSAQEDISDLQAEFELDRQDYLDTIRSQERMLRLHQQLLSTMVGLVRRDCNYYNIDKIKAECTWNEDEAVWILPRVTTTKTSLSLVVSHSTIQCRSASTSTLPSSSSSFGMGHRMKGASPSSSPRAPRHPGIMEEGEGERRPSGEEMEYFRPKRALELLAEGEQRRREGGRSDPHKWSSHTTPGMATGTPNAAAVHGLETLLAGDPGLSRRPGRLQSLPVNPSLPPSHPVPQTATDVLETVDKKLTKRGKRHSLEPITDMHKRPPPM